jgi:hypothetical protein
VIVTLVIEEFMGANLKWLTGLQFIAAMASVIAGLSSFLAEVCIATHTSQFDVRALAG